MDLKYSQELGDKLPANQDILNYREYIHDNPLCTWVITKEDIYKQNKSIFMVWLLYCYDDHFNTTTMKPIHIDEPHNTLLEELLDSLKHVKFALDKLDLHFIKNYAENIYGVYKQTHIDPSLFLFLEIFSSKSCFNDLQKSLLNKKVVIICLLFNSFDKYTNN
ncbi:hypothetical protein RI543_000467 [Arxiozyma heterogenica]|uniref:Uncharacterized protein n=1 Tax=Arxiozyma heterogenica TaxID=278026 RepID=A0AAN7ZYY7_9SACH|nr:hypothetical protein RI543_000467 [Kazachstania heterogenica]